MKRNIRRLHHRGAAVMLTVVLAAAIAGCKRTGPAKEYRIGAILTTTGEMSKLGEPEKKTLEMLVEEINKTGGIKGVPVKLIIRDDAGNPEQARKTAEELVGKEQALAIIGPSLTGTTMSIKDYLNDKKVPFLSCAAAEMIVSPVKPYVFKTPQSDRFAVSRIYKDMRSKGITNIAILHDSDGFGKLGAQQLKALAGPHGITVVDEEEYPKTATENDLVPLLTRIQGMKVQAVVNWTVSPAQSFVPKIMADKGMRPGIALYQSHGFGNIKFVEKTGKAAEGILFPAGRLIVADQLPDSNPQKKVLLDYKQAYESRYKGDNASTFGGHAFDAFNILAIALEKAGADREKIARELEKVQFLGTAGQFKFSKRDHNGLDESSLVMLIVKNGRFVLAGK